MSRFALITLLAMVAPLGGCAEEYGDAAPTATTNKPATTATTAAATTATDSDKAAATPDDEPADAELTLADIHGGEHHPLDLADGKPNVFIFITTDCPVSNAYAPEYNRLQADLSAEGVDLYLVQADRYMTAERATKHAADYQLTATVLLDPKQRLVRYTGARTTPECAVVAPDGKVAYLGRVNNLYEDFGVKRRTVTKNDLRDAVDAVLAGKPVAEPRIEVIGCAIPGT